LRSVLAVVAGLVLGSALMMGIEVLNSVIYSLPTDPEALKASLSSLPTGALLVVLLGWTLAPLVGGFVAAWIARRAPLVHALVVGLFFLAGGIAMLRQLPHPLWFAILGVAVFLPAACAGALLAPPRPSSQGRSAPRRVRESSAEGG
jgi:hypothetical protein